MTSQTPWVDGLTIGQALQETARRYPNQDALVFPQQDLTLSWSELSTQIDQAAKALLAMGIQKGEHVAIWATNVPQWVVLQFATTGFNSGSSGSVL